MRVLYDHQIFTAQKFGGISRYFCMLMDQLNQKNICFGLPAIYTNNYYLNDLKNQGKIGNNSIKSYNWSKTLQRYYNYHNRKESIKSVSGGHFDVFHPTYYDPYFLPSLGNKPMVVTVHDMIHEIFPEHFPADDPVIAWKQQLLENAAHVITVSANTKKDLLKFYDVDEKRVTVVYHGSSMQGTWPGVNISLPDRYILFVGDRHLYKNFYLFAESIAPLLKEDRELCLVCAGGKPFSPGENEFFDHMGIGGKVKYYQASDTLLTSLYRRALAFVYPSLYEGFGIPVLEAFSCDCPAVLSNSSSLPEVGGDAALYFDPKDVVSIRDTVGRVIYDEDLRIKMINSGHNRLANFSWEKCADETLAVYNSLLR